MDSGHHSSIITQVTRDSEHVKLVAELPQQASADPSKQPAQSDTTTVTIFSPAQKDNATAQTSQSDKANNSDLTPVPNGDKQTSKAKSLFCCFKICKKQSKNSASRYEANTSNQKAPNGSYQTDNTAQIDGTQVGGWSNEENHSDVIRSFNGGGQFGAMQPVHLLPPLDPNVTPRRCLVIDLDETLVHSSFKPVEKPDLTVEVEIDNIVHQIYVLKRPFVDEFLRRMGQLFECVLFTASLSKYADPVTNWLDCEEPNVFSARLFRDACVLHKGNYVKDLSRLGRPLDSVIIIDNSPASYCFHPQNAVPSRTWFDDMSDRELLDLIPLFETLATCPDIYAVLAQHHAERQAQHAQELALLRSIPLAYAAIHTPITNYGAPLPAYHLVAATNLQPGVPNYLQSNGQDNTTGAGSGEADNLLVNTHGELSGTAIDVAIVPETVSSGVPDSQVSLEINAEHAAGRATPLADPEVAAAAITAGADVSVEDKQTDEDRSLFSPRPGSPLYITPPTPKLTSHSHSASASHSHAWSAVPGEVEIENSRENGRQRRNSAGSHKWRRRDVQQQQRPPRPVSTQPMHFDRIEHDKQQPSHTAIDSKPQESASANHK